MFSTHLLMLNFFLVWVVGAAGSRSAQDTGFPQPPSDPLLDALDEDALTQHMSKLYEKYNRENRLKEGNTVRSVRGSQDPSDHRRVHRLNLTTLQDSEVVLSATFHFLLERRPHQKPWFCKRFKSPSCRSPAVHPSPSVSLLLRAIAPGSGVGSGSTGLLLGNVTFHPHRRGVWQMKDVTQVIKEARDKGHLLLSVELDLGRSQQRKPEEALSAPYLLVYANDSALAEPNSVAASLQRYDPFGDGGERQTNVPPGRARRDAAPLSEPIQNNELPEVEYRPDGYRKDDLWESTWYLALKPKHKPSKPEKKRKSPEEGEEQGNGREPSEGAKSDDARGQTPAAEGRRHERRHEGRDGKRHKGGTHGQSPVLSFDEQTMRKARRRQWAETQQRGCSRRNLRVDFADIGWSEWVMAPKAFDAYYCAGACGFPMPKLARPSNHATIQSIVRAVGIIPGVPEPCCVPEKMSPLAVLYHDEARNPVLKIYPNMSVQSCSCR